jgi:iron complex transport system permease protein
LALSLAPNPFAVTEIAFWLLGSLRDRSFTHVWLALPFLAVSWVIFFAQGKALLAFALGEDTARSLGISATRTQLWLGLALACGVGASVAVAGGIGFIGLIIPHLVRSFFGHDPSRILIPSALAGAVLLMAADVFVRVVPANGELRAGVVTALIGAPFFLMLILRERRGGAG